MATNPAGETRGTSQPITRKVEKVGQESHAKQNPPTPAPAVNGEPKDPFTVGEAFKGLSGTVEATVYDPEYGWLAVTSNGSIGQEDGTVSIGGDQYGGSYPGWLQMTKAADPNLYQQQSKVDRTFSGIKDNGNGTYTIKDTAGESYTFGATKNWEAAKNAAAQGKAAQTAQQQTDQLIEDSLDQYGFTAAQKAQLHTEIDAWITQGYSATDITDTLLPTTKVYQQAFPANAQLIKNGDQPLTPAAYLSLKQQYQQTAREFGINPAAYNPDQLIANNVSPDEFSSRLQNAYAVVANNPEIASAFHNYYKIAPNQLVSYMLNPKQNLNLLTKQAATAQIGAAGTAVGQRVSLAQANTLEHGGVTPNQLTSGLEQLQMQKQLLGRLPGQTQTALNSNQILAAASGVNVGQSSAAATQDQLKQRAQTQRNMFAGSARVGQTAQGDTGIGAVAR